MRYNVLTTMKIDNNTAVVIDGLGEELKVGMTMNDGKYKLLSIGMPAGISLNTSLLIEGAFDEKEVYA